MLRDDRPLHQQSLRRQNHPACARLQTSPTREGKRALPVRTGVFGQQMFTKFPLPTVVTIVSFPLLD